MPHRGLETKHDRYRDEGVNLVKKDTKSKKATEISEGNKVKISAVDELF